MGAVSSCSDIADATGLSPGQLSLALNDAEGISPRTGNG